MKTNKLWSIMMMLVLVLGTAISFSSCGDNDEETCNCNGDCHGTQCSAPCADDCRCTNIANKKHTDDIGGEYLKSVTEEYIQSGYSSNLYNFSYSDGKISKYQTTFDELVSSSVSGTEWIFNFDRYDSYVYKDITYDDENTKITSFTASGKSDAGFYEMKYSFTYNLDGQLAEIKGRGMNGYPERHTIRLIWNDNNIKTLDIDYIDEYCEGGSRTITFTYGSQINTNNQMTYALAEEIFSASFNNLELIAGLALIGKFGIGPRNLPVSYSVSASWGTESYPITYSLNKNGNIKEEIINDDKYTYSYE